MVNALQCCISPPDRPDENYTSCVHSYPVISEIQSDAKFLVKIDTKKKVTCTPTWSPVGGATISNTQIHDPLDSA